MDLQPGLSLISTAPPEWDCSASTATKLSCTYDAATTPFLPGDPPLVITVVVAIAPNASPIVVATAKVEILGDLLAADDTSQIVCNNAPPAPAPALSPLGMALAGLVLLGVAFLATRRLASAVDRRLFSRPSIRPDARGRARPRASKRGTDVDPNT
jgi:hypothetical protein